MAAEKVTTLNDIQVLIGTKAMKDETYRQELLRDPKAVLGKELRQIDPSITLPESLKVEVHEQSQNKLHLFLPSRVPSQAQAQAQASAERAATNRPGYIF